jgi:hypothetical protein
MSSNTELIISLLSLLVIGLSIWLSFKAKPLGSFTFRWGAFCAYSGILGLPVFVLEDTSKILSGNMSSKLAFIIVMQIYTLLISIGLLNGCKADLWTQDTGWICVSRSPALLQYLYAKGGSCRIGHHANNRTLHARDV